VHGGTGFAETVEEIVQLENRGLDTVFVAEAYTFDAVSQLGFLAARTSRVQLATGIVPIYTRTPALIAMTAAGLDHVSDGRFMLGLGASGPQVIEGFHGLEFDAPVARTREVINICRTIWRREPLVHRGSRYQIPLPPDRGTGLGKPLKLSDHPVRERIPILLAATGPRNVELAAEAADAWLPIFFHPERAGDVWDAALLAGNARRSTQLGDLEVHVTVPLAIGDDTEDLLQLERRRLALYIGGMGARGRNFYHDLACRYGYETDANRIQDLYLQGRTREAEAEVQTELLRATTLIGPPRWVKERLAAFRDAGVTTINVMLYDKSADRRLRSFEQLLHISAQ
jgi:F420-dependent oxidoreductase-like protein